VRERRKEPREGSEIEPETACIQTVGAPAQWAFGSFEERGARLKRIQEEIEPTWKQAGYGNSEDVYRRRATLDREAIQKSNCTMDSSRVHRAGVTAYLLYNGSATYVLLRA